MLSNTTTGRRHAGRALVAIAVAAALPLTATKAINYVDVPRPAKAPAAAPKAFAAPPVAHAPVAAVSAVAATAVAQPAPAAPAEPPAHVGSGFHFDGKEKIVINGREKKWSELTPAEKAQIRSSIARAKQELARTRIDREQIRRDIREAMAEAMADRDDHRRDLDRARADIERAVREIDAHKAEIRRSGQDPEQIKATVRASLRAVQAIDVAAIRRQALASVDHRAIEASVAEAERSVARALAEIERIEVRLDTEE